MKGRLILIQYYAVRNEIDEYKGVVEATQEISDIIKIEGEKNCLTGEYNDHTTLSKRVTSCSPCAFINLKTWK